MTRFNRPCTACTMPYDDEDSLDLDDTHNGVQIDDGDDVIEDDGVLIDSHGAVTGAGYDLLGRMDAAGEFI
jgi:hypothetical protein